MKQKPFNLEAALAGKPVLLRNGSKAFVKFVMPNPVSEINQIAGYVCYGDGKCEVITWSIDGIYGRFYTKHSESFDIIGMCSQTINIGGFDVPKPVTEPLAVGTEYYYVDISSPFLFYEDCWTNINTDYRLLKNGIIHLTEDNARAHAKALLELTKSAMEEAG